MAVIIRPPMRSQAYEVIKAKNAAEAMEQSRWNVGDLARITAMHALANSDGTFSVFPEFEKEEADEAE